jgi:hypothetical protein
MFKMVSLDRTWNLDPSIVLCQLTPFQLKICKALLSGKCLRNHQYMMYCLSSRVHCEVLDGCKGRVC